MIREKFVLKTAQAFLLLLCSEIITACPGYAADMRVGRRKETTRSAKNWWQKWQVKPHEGHPKTHDSKQILSKSDTPLSSFQQDGELLRTPCTTQAGRPLCTKIIIFAGSHYKLSIYGLKVFIRPYIEIIGSGLRGGGRGGSDPNESHLNPRKYVK